MKTRNWIQRVYFTRTVLQSIYSPTNICSRRWDGTLTTATRMMGLNSVAQSIGACFLVMKCLFFWSSSVIIFLDPASSAVCEEVCAVPTAVCEEVCAVPTAVCEVCAVPTAVCEEVCAVPTAVCEEVCAVPTAVCERSVLFQPLSVRIEVCAVPTAVCEDVCAVPTTVCEEVCAVPRYVMLQLSFVFFLRLVP